MLRIALIASLLVGCADLGAVEDDDCQTSLLVTPAGDPEVGQEVRVTAQITTYTGGVPDIDWRVRFDQQDIPFTGNGSMEIAFTPTEPGTYSVDMTPSAPGVLCNSEHADINVVMGAGVIEVRLHIAPPPGMDVPPTDRVIRLPAAPTYSLNTVTLSPGGITNGNVGMPAYMRFIPDGEPEAVVETYANASGDFSARVLLTPHHIVIVPTNTAYPPQIVADNSLTGSETYTLTTGVAITGTVLRPNGTPLADAKIQVFQNDTSGITIPSTIGTSAANGTFTLRSFSSSGTNARVVVTPPAGSGLPRLEAQSQSFNFANPISVSYGASLVTRNVSGTTVTRSGALANAKVTIVGTLPFNTAGTIAAGGSAAASGFVRIPMTANSSGVLPSTLVPASDLFAVVEPAGAAGDSAVVAFNTTSAVPSTITAPAMQAFSTTVRLGGQALGGVRFELVPSGALGMAGVGPTTLYANEAGVISGTMASGAIYKTYVSDPSRQAGPKFYPMLDATSVATAFDLLPSLVLSGSLQVQGQTNRIEGAAVQVFCNTDDLFLCESLDRDRAVGEDASSSQGTFEVAVTRPTAM